MLYNTPAKGEDGCYFVRAVNDDKKKYFVQLNKVQVTNVSGGELTIDLRSNANQKKIAAIDEANLQAAQENSVEWFGKAKLLDALKKAYSAAELVASRIPPTKVFSADQEVIDFESIQEGRDCSIILEYAGMWFAKTAFGPSYNVVQVKLHPEPIKSEYPEEYAFVEEEEEAEPEAIAEPEPEPEVEVVTEPAVSEE